MTLQPAYTLSAPRLVVAAAALSLQPVHACAPTMGSAQAGALCFAVPKAQPVQAVPALQIAGLRFKSGTPMAITADMLLAIKGDPGEPGEPGSAASLSHDAGQLARMGLDGGIYVSQDDVRAVAADQDAALITDFDALVAATLGV